MNQASPPDARAAEIRPGEGRLAHAAPDHPALPRPRVGILLANLGTPDATDYWSMRRYLREFLSDRRVIDYPAWRWQPLLQLVILSRRPFTSGAAYRGIWNRELDESPLLTTTRAQAAKLAERVKARFGDDVLVDFCMRYGNPSTRGAIGRMKAAGCERILFFPLYPQYASATTATACDEAFRALMELKWQPAIRTAPSYHDHPLYIEALARSVEAAFPDAGALPDALVVSYHGMPVRYLAEGDPYHCQCRKTSRLLEERLGWDRGRMVTTFQSRFGPEEWLQPYTVEEVARLAQTGRTRIAVMAPAFSSDCVETLEEIQGEIRESFTEAGGEDFAYVPCLNDGEDHIDMIMDIAVSELGGWIDA